jgi:hypothetical protein
LEILICLWKQDIVMTLAAMYREKKLLSIAKDVKTCLPAAHKKLVGGSFKKHDVKVIERVEKPKVDELMNSYLQLLSETEVSILSFFRVRLLLIVISHKLSVSCFGVQV